MKKLFKMLVPALLVAAAVGVTTIGCGDDTSTPTTTGDMAVHTGGGDMAHAAVDMTHKGD